MVDARYQLDVQIDYEENCEYRASTINKKVSIPSQNTVCTIAVSTNDSLKVGDNCTVTATVQTQITPRAVKSGYVNFYFTPNSDKSNAIQINKKPYPISKEGKVSTKYKMVRSGYLYAEYIDYSGFFNSSESSITRLLTVNKIRTSIEFISSNKYIEDLQETINIKVRVKDADNNTPIKYGTVTFLHYPKPINLNDINSDPEISVISNPAYLDENGYATISYVPMQEYNEDSFLLGTNETDVEIYKEIVKAVYNYDNSWDYYSSSYAYCDIFLKRPNILAIEVIDSQEYDYKWNYITESNNIRLKATLSDDIINPYSNNVNFNNGDEILFDIQGTRAIPNGDIPLAENNIDYFVENNFIYTEIEYNNIPGIYNNDGFYATLSNNNIYLYPGFYTITAKLNIDKGSHSGYEEYLANTTPIEFYLQVIYASNNTINISSTQSLYNYNRGQTINDIVVSINNLTQDELYVLNNKSCYFYSITDNKNIHTSTLTQVGNKLQATLPGNKINNTIMQDYQFYAYIKGQYYSNGDVNKKIKRVESNIITVSIRDTLNISINAQVNNNTYPADVEYVAAIENIYQGTIKASIYNKNKTTNNEQKIQDIVFGPNISEYRGNITNPLSPADYALIMRTDNHNDVISNYTITKSIISQYLGNETTEVINNPNERINLILHTSGNDFANINNNNFQLYIKKHNDNNWTQIQNPDIIFSTVQNNTVMYLKCKIAQYEIDEWDIQARYNDNNFVNNNTYCTFTTRGIAPSYEIDEYIDGERIVIHITGTSYPQCVPILIKVYNASNMEKFIGITNQNGIVSIPYPNTEDWMELTNIELNINPTHEDLIQSISSNSTNHLSSAVTGYNRVYFGLPSDNDTTIYNSLRNQLSTYENKYLFIIYGENRQVKSRTFG